MPSALSYPGVYIEEIPSGVHAIVGVSTSIAAFVGRTAKGPIDRAVHITDRSGFIRTFGGPNPDSDLADGFRQFFDNGGTDCYIVRVAHQAVASTLTLQTLKKADILVATARDKGEAGNDLRLEVDYATANPDDTFNLRVFEERGQTVMPLEEYTALSMNPNAPRFAPTFVTESSTQLKLDAAIPDLDAATPAAANPACSESRRPLVGNSNAVAGLLNAIVTPTGAPTPPPAGRFEISVDDGPFTAVDIAGAPFTGDSAAVANEIKTRINAQIPATTPVAVNWQTVTAQTRVLRIASDTTARASVRIRPSGFQDLAGPLMLGANQGGVEVGRYQALRPAPTATVYSGDPNDLAKLTQDAFNAIQIDTEPAISLMDGVNPILQTTVAGDAWYKEKAGATPSSTGDNDGIREKLRILATALNSSSPPPTGIRTFRAEVWGYHLALIPTLGISSRSISVATTPDATFGQKFTANSRRYAMGHPAGSPFAPTALAGSNGSGPPDINDFVGDPVTGSGMHALDTVDIFNLMVLPSDKALGEPGIKQLIGPASVYCGDRRAMLLVDAPTAWTNATTGRPNAGAADVDGLRALTNSKNTAVYYPRLVYSSGGSRKRIGPSGAVAGVMARTDVERGVWKAPAGTEATIRGILDLESKLTDLEQGILNKAGANVIRIFPSGIVVWGARTLKGTDDDPNEWKYVPIRRFALFLEESLFRGTKWVVFEPNDEPLWANIRKNIRAFMLGLFRQGAFEGATPDLAFYVKCDGETTTANDRNLGIVNIEVGFAPLKPAEFVVIKIQQIANDTE